MITTALDQIVVDARRSGKFAGERLRLTRSFEQLFFHHPTGNVEAVPIVFKGTRVCSDGSAYDEYGPMKQPGLDLDAVIPTHQDQAVPLHGQLPIPGPKDGVIPASRRIPN